MKAKHFRRLEDLFQSVKVVNVLKLFLDKYIKHKGSRNYYKNGFKPEFEYDLKELEKDSYLNEDILTSSIKRLIDEDFLSCILVEDKSYYIVNIKKIFDYVLDEDEMLELL